MKKLISLILALCMLCTLSTAMAEDASAADNAKSQEDGTITVSVDGEEWVFYLESAKLLPSLDQMWATYYAFNPRGETNYKLLLKFSDDIKPGKYKTGTADVSISLNTDDLVGKNGGIQNMNSQYMTRGKKDGTIVIEERSSDWTTYKGSFDTDVTNREGEKIHIECDSFEFTLGEERELPYKNDWADSGATSGSFQNKPFF